MFSFAKTNWAVIPRPAFTPNSTLLAEICERKGQIMQRRLLCSRNHYFMCASPSTEDVRPRHLVCQHIRLYMWAWIWL